VAEGSNKRNLDKASLSPDANQLKEHQGDWSPEKREDNLTQGLSGEMSSADKLAICNK